MQGERRYETGLRAPRVRACIRVREDGGKIGGGETEEEEKTEGKETDSILFWAKGWRFPRYILSEWQGTRISSCTCPANLSKSS